MSTVVKTKAQEMIEEFEQRAKEQLAQLKAGSAARVQRYVERGMASLKENCKD